MATDRAVLHKRLAISSDGKGNAVYAPTAGGQVRALKNAYDLAGVSRRRSIDRRSTRHRYESRRQRRRQLPSRKSSVKRSPTAPGALGSVKSMIGHTKGAAGAADHQGAGSLQRLPPPTIKVKKPVEPLEPGKSPCLCERGQPAVAAEADHPRRAGMSAFGFGGSNFTRARRHSSHKAALRLGRPDADCRALRQEYGRIGEATSRPGRVG